MADTIKVEAWALYGYKLAVKECLAATNYIKQSLAKLDLREYAFGQVSNSSATLTAWNDASDARQREIKALHDLAEEVNTALGDVLALYGYTDTQLAKRLRDAERHGV
ncbi:MAG: hypothetical protein ACRDT6_21055 [Micromonosporaceae bacterium]